MKRDDKRIKDIFKEQKIEVKNLPKVEDPNHQIDTGGPTLGENDLPQAQAQADWNTITQTSPESPQVINMLQLNNSTPPLSGNINKLLNMSQKYSDPAANISYTNYMANGMVDITSTSFVHSMITYYKQIHLSKFEYEGFDDIDCHLLEERLWLFGAVCIVELDKKYILPYKTLEVDLNGTPTKILPLLPTNSKLYKKIKFKPLTGDDMVYFINDYNGFFEKMETYSPLYRHWFHIQVISALQIEILNNAHNSKTRIWINTKGKSDLEVENLLKQYNSGSPIMLGDFIGVQARQLQGMDTGDSVIDITDRTEMLWLNVRNLKDELKTFMGLRTNAGVQKKEKMVNDEINVENQSSQLSLLSELYLREQGVERANKRFGYSGTVKLREIELDSENDKYNNDKENKLKGKEDLA